MHVQYKICPQNPVMQCINFITQSMPLLQYLLQNAINYYWCGWDW